jgi:hypothetical protein
LKYVLLRVAASAAPRLPSRNSGVSRSISGRTETIRTFVNIAYATQGIELEWEGSGTDEGALCRKTGKTLVAVDAAYHRPAEVQALIGDASKAAKKLGWVPRTGLGAIIEEMVSRTSTGQRRFRCYYRPWPRFAERSLMLLVRTQRRRR